MSSKEDQILEGMNEQAQEWAEEMAKAAGVPYACTTGHVFFTGWKPRADPINVPGEKKIYWAEPLGGQWLDWRNKNQSWVVPLNCLLGQKDGIKKMLQAGLEQLLSLSKEKGS